MVVEDVSRVVLDVEFVPTFIEGGVDLNVFEDSSGKIKIALQTWPFLGVQTWCCLTDRA